jgi:hypothetical protein
MIENASDAVESSKSPSWRRRNLVIAAGMIAGLAIVFVVAVVVFLFVDPFGWNLFGRRQAENAARAIPADMAFYASLNMRNMNCEDLNPIVWAFSEELKAEGTCAVDELFEYFDDYLEETAGMTFNQDVKPWIGEAIAIGLDDLDFSMDGDFRDIRLVLAVEARGPKAADDFLVRLMAAITEKTGEQFVEETYQDRTLYYVEDSIEGTEPFVFTLSGDMLLFGIGKNTIEAAIDAQQGESLADVAGFQETIQLLPSGRILTFYIDFEGYLEMMSGLLGGMFGLDPTSFYDENLGAMPAAAAGISIVDEGIQVDTAYKMDVENLSEEMRSVYEMAQKQPRTASLMPEGTVIYFVNQRLDMVWANLRQTIIEGSIGTDFDESMDMAQLSLGFNPDKDLFPNLDGEWALGVLPSSEGVLVDELDATLGFAFVLETSDPDAIKGVVEEFSLRIEQQGMGEVESEQIDEATLYQLVDMFTGQSLVSYGVVEDHLIIGSSMDTLAELFTDRPSLSQSRQYKDVVRAFPRDTDPVLYVDIQGLVATLRENMSSTERELFDQDVGRIWKPITCFAIESGPLRGDTMKATMILFIDTER